LSIQIFTGLYSGHTKGQKKETLPEKISVHNLAISVYFNPKHMF